jgi:predicted XRE-type DNA-binding protein
MTIKTVKKRIEQFNKNEKENSAILNELNTEVHELVKESGIKQKIIAEKMGILHTSFSAKLNKKQLKMHDIEMILSILDKVKI